MRYRAVLFDLDGLLVDSELLNYHVISDLLSQNGHTLQREVFARLLSVSTADCDTILSEVYGEAAPLYAVTGPEYRRRITAGELKPRPGAAELLDRLDSLGVLKAVASSNSGDNVGLSLRSTGLDVRFPVIVNGDMVEHTKPAPDLFLLAAEQLGVAPEDCLVLEDSFAGVRGARAAGMDAILVPDFAVPNDDITAQCAAICADLHEVAAQFFPLEG